jgi:ribosomal protein S12 methylthiotransferase
MNKIGVISLGCAKNLVDTEIMLGLLSKSGYKITNSYQNAEVIIINTCGFIKEAKEESIEAILEAIKFKESGKVKRIIVTGCLSQRYKKELEKEFPEVDIFLGVNEYPYIKDAIEKNKILWSDKLFLPDHTYPRLLSTPFSWTYLKISEGCSHQCSFCAIPLIRGSYRSRTIDSIIEEAINLASKGIKEINIISQDSTYYGKDLGMKNGLVKLLEKLIDIKELKWIRVLYCVPEEITDPFLDILQEEKICSYLDIPFQHSDKKIINMMGRKFDGRRSLELIAKIRKKIPDITIRTSLIVGFPGEGEQEFQDLKQFCKTAQFDRLGVFTYSREEGTKAFSLGDPIPQKIKEKRKEEIMKLQAEISYRKNREMIGKKVEVLVEGESKENPNFLIGRLQSQAPEVDGIVLIEKNKKFNYNSFLNIVIYDAFTYDLKGRIIN